MTRCYVSEQIAAYCSQDDDILGCWDCEEPMWIDDLIEVETLHDGIQFVCEDCAGNYERVI